MPPSPELNLHVVTTETVPGKTCRVPEGEGAKFPAMVLLPSGGGAKGVLKAAVGGTTLSGGALGGLRALREAAQEAGANAVLGVRAATSVTRSGNARVLFYGTLAICE